MSKDQDLQEERGVDRRTAIKKTVAAGAAVGLVWSAPRIEGLTVRPRYAAASSHTAGGLDFSFDRSGPSGGSAGVCGPGLFVINGFYSDEVSGIFGFFDFSGGATGTVNQIDATGGAAGWNTWTPPSASPSPSAYSMSSNGSPSPGPITVHVEFDCA